MDLHVSLVGRRDLAGQIYAQLRAAILDGRLRAGRHCRRRGSWRGAWRSPATPSASPTTGSRPRGS
ncbi:hypothetical protein ACFQY7_55580 [Actinomadura luteofluorescens]|uniref:hypothetical protein n=1 Tax=Actinomadura luteofluorescens TaxID=46163 RepID=UPI003632187A